MGVIKRNYDIQVQRGRMSEAEVDQRMGLLTGTTELRRPWRGGRDHRSGV